MSINILEALSAVTVTTKTSGGSLRMTEEVVAQVKEKLARENRGMSVRPNVMNINKPYRVSLRYNQSWVNYGNYESVEVATAVAAIISVAYFGEKAKRGEFDAALVQDNSEFTAFLANPKYALAIAKGTVGSEVTNSALVEENTAKPVAF